MRELMYMHVLTLKTQSAANPGYLEYTINFKYYFHRASGVYVRHMHETRTTRTYIYILVN